MAWGMVAGAAISVVGGALLSDDHGASDANASASQESGEQARLAGVQADIAQSQWDRYRKIYGPLEEEYLNESKNLGSIANQNHDAQQAAADVASGFAGAREQLNETPGLNPNSDAYLRAANRINLAEAASSATGQSAARKTAQDRGRAALTDAVSLGKGLPASAGSILASAGAGLGSAARLYQQQAQYGQQQANATGAGFGKLIGGITGSKGFQDWMSSPNDSPASLANNSPLSNDLVLGNGSLAD